MRILIFSDTHLGHNFELKKFNKLKALIESVDKVIINGDFWEGFKMSFDEFINSSWNGLFSSLKEKDAVYLYGNHDKQELCTDAVNLFSSTHAKQYQFKLGNVLIHVEHGDLIAPSIEVKYPFFTKKILQPIGTGYEKILYALFKEKYLNFQYEWSNVQMKEWKKKNLPNNEYLICGHSHLAEFNQEINFYNSGFIRHGAFEYLLIEDDKIRLVKDTY